MELFEISAKDDTGKLRQRPITRGADIPFCPLGVNDLFHNLITVLISRKDELEQQNQMAKRESIILPPSWAALADEEESRLAARNPWMCCPT